MISNYKSVLVHAPLSGAQTGQSIISEKILKILRCSILRVKSLNNNYQNKSILSKTFLTIFEIYSYFIKIVFVDCYYISFKRGSISIYCSWLFISSARLLRKKIIIHLHGNELLTDDYSFLNRKVVSSIYSSAKLIICLNHWQKQNIQSRYFVKNIYVLPNYSENRLSRSEIIMKKNKIMDREKYRITYFSNIMIEKGVSRFLDFVIKYHDLAEFHLAGNIVARSNKERVMLLKKIEIAKLSGLIYHGFISGLQKNSLLENSDFLFFLSTYPTEAQPISIIEGSSFGVIPICLKRNYTSTIVSSNSAILIDEPVSLDDLGNILFEEIDRNTVANMMQASWNISEKFTLHHFEDNVMRLVNIALR
jgi:glycosyltransferase involved in cell wall biosynthesis